LEIVELYGRSVRVWKVIAKVKLKDQTHDVGLTLVRAFEAFCQERLKNFVVRHTVELGADPLTHLKNFVAHTVELGAGPLAVVDVGLTHLKNLVVKLTRLTYLKKFVVRLSV